MNATTVNDRSNHQMSSTGPIRIVPSKPSPISEQPSVLSNGKSYASNIRDELPESSGDITDLDTDPAGDFSPYSKTETDSLASATNRYIDEAVDFLSYCCCFDTSFFEFSHQEIIPLPIIQKKNH